ncbi:MAG: tetratricopeptide repeat protein [bacterium]|nr:tetratricopeptide repeat protein [bacterium]
MISPRRSRIELIFAILTLLLPILLGLVTIKARVGSPHDASRMATIQSIVEQHRFAIDQSILPLAVDIIKIEGKTYSDKPPMLAILGSGIYFILYHLFHLTFANHYAIVYYLITLFLVTIPLGIICFTLNKLFEQKGLSFKIRIGLFLFTWLGTIMFPFSVTFTNHLLAAATATLAFYFLMQSHSQEKKAGWLPIWLGFFSALTFTLDLPAGGLLLITFALIFFYQHHRMKDMVGFILGLLPPLIVHFSANYALTGDFIPAYLHPQYYQYPGSVLDSAIGKKRLFGETIPGQYWHMLFGYRGIFLFSPLLIFGLIECGKGLLPKYWQTAKWMNQLRMATLLIFFGTLTAYAIQISDFGGTSYGLRWIITSIPLLIYFLGLHLKNKIRKLKKWILILCLIWSIIVALIGLYNPWSLNIISPNPVIDNLAYITLDYFPNQPWIAETILERTSLEKGLAYYELGKYYLNRGEPTRAIPYYYKSIENDPKHTLTYYHLGMALDMVGKSEEAIPIYEKLLDAEPNNIGALNNFGISLIKAGDFLWAETIYRRSISLDSTRAIAHFGLAVALFEQSKTMEAEKECRFAVALEPDFLPAKKLLGAIEDRKKNPKR